MYEIKKDNNTIAITEHINYVRQHKEGFYYLCEPTDAECAVIKGIIYPLSDVAIIERDAGELLLKNIEASSIAFVTMAEAGTIDAVTAGEHVDVFTEWTYPVHYKVGNLRKHRDKLYKCIQEHTSQENWGPDVAVSLWCGAADPYEEWPEWSQPVGAHDAYAKGAKTSRNDKKWISDIDGNVWEPGVYGWTEYVEE